MNSLLSEDCQINESNDLYPRASESLRFPIDDSMQIVFTGYYNGFNVEVRSAEEVSWLYHMGCFGKGSTSRSRPSQMHNNDGPQVMRRRQYLKRNYWYKKFYSHNTSEVTNFLKDIDELTSKILADSDKLESRDIIDLISSDEDSDGVQECSSNNAGLLESHNKEDIVMVVPNSDSENEDYFVNIKPKCCVSKIKTQEKLILSPEEAFFLVYGLGCLQIVNSDNYLLNIEQFWMILTANDNNFMSKYIVYHYFRSKGYIVKPGIKFGGDYLLYKDGPGVCHADYIVVMKSDVKKNDWISILGHVRMATTTVKEVLIVEVVKPSNETPKLPQGLGTYKVREVLLTRNIPATINNDD